MYREEARDFLRTKAKEIERHMTDEHYKLVQRLIDIKERTFSQIAKNEELEKTVKSLTMNMAIEQAQKEAIYAMDDTNPLRLYNCLIPEITAYRPMKILTDQQKANNFKALQKLKKTELAIVSALMQSVCF